MELQSPFLLLFFYSLLGIFIWFGTQKIYDLVNNAFAPLEPKKPVTNEKQIVHKESSYEEGIETIVVRGGKGNPKIITWTQEK